jgi:two-component system, NarL family, invasion response regulator UvrY
MLHKSEIYPVHQDKSERRVLVSSILLIGECWVVRHGLRQAFLDEFRDVRFVEAPSVSDGLAKIVAQPWTFVLVDGSVWKARRLRVLEEILRIRQDSKVFVLNDHFDSNDAAAAAQLGAFGYVAMDESRTDFIRIFRRALIGESHFGPFRRAELLDRRVASHHALSARELKVLVALASGKRPGEIAAELNLSIKTVSTYKRRILNKMSMNSVADMVRYALEHQLTSPNRRAAVASPTAHSVPTINSKDEGALGVAVGFRDRT